MNITRAWLTVLTLVALLLPLSAQAQSERTQKLAFLVGVDKYQKAGLSELNYPDDDVRELETELKRLKFDVVSVIGLQATRAEILRRWDKFLDQTKLLNKTDLAFVALAGHGLQLEVERAGVRASDAFFCPVDAHKSDPATLISISDLMKGLSTQSGSLRNLMVIDACRDDPTRGGRGFDGGTVKDLPAKLGVIFACSAGQRSFEADSIKHGVFTHVLLQGLRGAAANPEGKVTWHGLTGHAADKVPDQVAVLIGKDFTQNPNSVANLSSDPVFVTFDKITTTKSVIPGGGPGGGIIVTDDVLFTGRTWVLHVEDNSSSERRVFIRELTINDLKDPDTGAGKVQRTHADEGRFTVVRDPLTRELQFTLERPINGMLATFAFGPQHKIDNPTTLAFSKSPSPRSFYKQSQAQYTIYLQSFPQGAFPLSPLVANIRPNGIFPAVGLGLEDSSWRYQLLSDGKKPWQPLTGGNVTFLLDDLCAVEDKMLYGVIGFTVESYEELRRGNGPRASLGYEIYASDEKLISRTGIAYSKPLEISQKIPRGTQSIRISVNVARGNVLWSDFHLASYPKPYSLSPSKEK